MEVGKCVHADTEIEIKIPNNELITDFVKIKKYIVMLTESSFFLICLYIY